MLFTIKSGLLLPYLIKLCYLLLPLSHNIVRIGFRESQATQTLTKFIDKMIHIYNTWYIPYDNIFHDTYNGNDLVF